MTEFIATEARPLPLVDLHTNFPVHASLYVTRFLYFHIHFDPKVPVSEVHTPQMGPRPLQEILD